MKQLYSGALFVLTLSFFTLSSSAQSGGTYTAVQSGDWHTASGPGIWQAAEPPQNCSNCLIILNVNGTVNLNTNVNLASSSQLVVGGTGNTTRLAIGNSGATNFANSFSLIMVNDGTNSKIALQNGAFVDASSAGAYDGLLTSFPSGSTTSYFKQVGNAPNGFVDNTIASNGNASFGTTLVGAANLSSTGTLPIILGNFSAVVDNGSVDLAWSTDLEINSDHFTIQSSTNAGATWNTVGTIPAAGNSASVLNYSFNDSHPASGTSEYRLVLVDRNGSTAYSQVKAVRLGAVSAINVYPNPASDYVNVTLTGDASVSANIRLVNLAGQVLMEKNVTNAGGTTVPLAVSSYPTGNYLIVITGSDGSKQVNKILITK
ncbi:MAG TPA: T9SS type A sorting domain-containing protein [Puia sp.]|jgi:hypothetical protein|nr:T9SS type A sorting domain-containing protein [Puia sp.]